MLCLKSAVLATLLNLAAIGTAATTATANGITEYVVEADFMDVRLDLADAIINRGFAVDHENYIHDMLERTGEDLGDITAIYLNAELVQFCSAKFSRDVMAANPAHIAFCPYILFVYERADRPGMIHVGFRMLDVVGSEASQAALSSVNAMLDEIVQEAADQ